MLNPPLTFVIDTTKSVKPDKDSIFNLTKKVVDSIKIDSINIPRSVPQYLLTTVYQSYIYDLCLSDSRWCHLTTTDQT